MKQVLDSRVLQRANSTTRAHASVAKTVLGLPLQIGGRDAVLRRLERRLVGRSGGYTAAGNLEKALARRSSPELAVVIDNASMVVADGFPLAFWATLRWRRRTSRIDLPTAALELSAKHNKRVYLLGTTEDTVERAARKASEAHCASVIGWHHGFFGAVEEITPDLQKDVPDVVLVGMGSPRQEFIVATLSEKMSQTLFIPCGGALDIMGGRKRRAPRLVRKFGFEWLFRMIQEPHRLGRFWRILLRSLR